MYVKIFVFSGLCSIIFAPVWSMDQTKVRTALQSPTDETITIHTQDGKQLVIKVRYALLSKTIKKCIKDTGINAPIELQTITSNTWHLIHRLLQTAYKTNNDTEYETLVTDDSKAILQTLSGQELISLLDAVNYLDIPILLKLAIEEIKRTNRLREIPAELVANMPQEIRNPIILYYLVSLFGTRPARELFICEGHTGPITSVCTTKDGRIISGSEDKTVRIWFSETGKLLGCCKGHTGSVTSLCTTRNGNIVSGSDDGTIRIWNNRTNTELAICQNPSDPVIWICATKEGKIISGAYDDTDTNDSDLSAGPDTITVRVWDSETDHQRIICQGHTYLVSSACATKDGTVITGSYDGTIRVWDSKTGNLVTNCEGHACEGDQGAINAVCATKDGKIVSASNSSIRIWDGKTGHQIAICEDNGHRYGADSIHVTKDGRLISKYQGISSVYNCNTGLLLGTIMNTHGELYLTKDGKVFSESGLHAVGVWDSKTGLRMINCKGHTDTVTSACATKDGKFIAGSRNGTIRVWDISIPLPKNVSQAKNILLILKRLIELSQLLKLKLDENNTFWELIESSYEYKERERIYEKITFWKDVENLFLKEIEAASIILITLVDEDEIEVTKECHRETLQALDKVATKLVKNTAENKSHARLKIKTLEGFEGILKCVPFLLQNNGEALQRYLNFLLIDKKYECFRKIFIESDFLGIKLFFTTALEMIQEFSSLIPYIADTNDETLQVFLKLHIDFPHLKLLNVDFLCEVDKKTGLINASLHGNNAIVELLLKAGANTNLQDSEGYTALMHASKKGHKNIVKLLLKAGANR